MKGSSEIFKYPIEKFSIIFFKSSFIKSLSKSTIKSSEELRMGKKRGICVTLDEKLVKEMEKIREETGIPISLQVELRLKGYKICKIEEKET